MSILFPTDIQVLSLPVTDLPNEEFNNEIALNELLGKTTYLLLQSSDKGVPMKWNTKCMVSHNPEEYAAIPRKYLKKLQNEEEKKMGKPCDTACRLKCSQNFSIRKRLQIFKDFWELGDRNKQWEFLLQHTRKMHKNRHTREVLLHPRLFTFKYFLSSDRFNENNEPEKLNVCKTMFCNTLAVGDRPIKTAWRKHDGLPPHKKKKRIIKFI